MGASFRRASGRVVNPRCGICERVGGVGVLFRKVLIVFILLLPFQDTLGSILSSGNVWEWAFLADEGATLLLLLLFFVYALHSQQRVRLTGGKTLALSVIVFVVIGLLSVITSRVSWLQGAVGLYDYIKNLVVLYGVGVLRWERRELFVLLRGISTLVVILALAAIAGEVLAKSGLQSLLLVQLGEQRLGLYRATPLVGHGNANYLGMYALLALTMTLLVAEKKQASKSVFPITLIFLTLSRQAWLGMVVLFLSLRRAFIAPMAVVLAVIFSLVWLERDLLLNPDAYFRLFTYMEAVKIWAAHPLLGAGPGMYGGVVSVTYGSPFYLGWPVYFQEFLEMTRGIDAFWPALLAETGVLGFSSFVMMWTALFGALRRAGRAAQLMRDNQLARVSIALRVYLVALAVMCSFSGLNKAFITFTFFTLCGIYLSVVRSVVINAPNERRVRGAER